MAKLMNEKTIRALVEAGAVKKIKIIGDGAFFHAEIFTPNGSVIAQTNKGDIKTWSSLDTSAKWVRALGIGEAQLQLAKWRPDQRALTL
jgi:hypothetical protein